MKEAIKQPSEPSNQPTNANSSNKMDRAKVLCRLFKNPPQPHMCVQDFLANSSDPCFVNVLSWSKLTLPMNPKDPIPLYGGMKVNNQSTNALQLTVSSYNLGRQLAKPPITFAVMANPEVLKVSGKKSADIKDRDAFIDLMLDFVEAMNPGVMFQRRFIVLNDRDLAGELKDIWYTVHDKRERERMSQSCHGEGDLGHLSRVNNVTVRISKQTSKNMADLTVKELCLAADHHDSMTSKSINESQSKWPCFRPLSAEDNSSVVVPFCKEIGREEDVGWNYEYDGNEAFKLSMQPLCSLNLETPVSSPAFLSHEKAFLGDTLRKTPNTTVKTCEIHTNPKPSLTSFIRPLIDDASSPTLTFFDDEEDEKGVPTMSQGVTQFSNGCSADGKFTDPKLSAACAFSQHSTDDVCTGNGNVTDDSVFDTVQCMEDGFINKEFQNSDGPKTLETLDTVQFDQASSSSEKIVVDKKKNCLKENENVLINIQENPYPNFDDNELFPHFLASSNCCDNLEIRPSDKSTAPGFGDERSKSIVQEQDYSIECTNDNFDTGVNCGIVSGTDFESNVEVLDSKRATNHEQSLNQAVSLKEYQPNEELPNDAGDYIYTSFKKTEEIISSSVNNMEIATDLPNNESTSACSSVISCLEMTPGGTSLVKYSSMANVVKMDKLSTTPICDSAQTFLNCGTLRTSVVNTTPATMLQCKQVKKQSNTATNKMKSDKNTPQDWPSNQVKVPNTLRTKFVKHGASVAKPQLFGPDNTCRRALSADRCSSLSDTRATNVNSVGRSKDFQISLSKRPVAMESEKEKRSQKQENKRPSRPSSACSKCTVQSVVDYDRKECFQRPSKKRALEKTSVDVAKTKPELKNKLCEKDSAHKTELHHHNSASKRTAKTVSKDANTSTKCYKSKFNEVQSQHSNSKQCMSLANTCEVTTCKTLDLPKSEPTTPKEQISTSDIFSSDMNTNSVNNISEIESSVSLDTRDDLESQYKVMNQTNEITTSPAVSHVSKKLKNEKSQVDKQSCCKTLDYDSPSPKVTVEYLPFTDDVSLSDCSTSKTLLPPLGCSTSAEYLGSNVASEENVIGESSVQQIHCPKLKTECQFQNIVNLGMKSKPLVDSGPAIHSSKNDFESVINNCDIDNLS